MKRLILSSLIILTSCSAENTFLQTNSNIDTNKQNLISSQNKDQQQFPLTTAILAIEDKKTSVNQRKLYLDKIISYARDDPDAMFYLAALYEEGKLIPLSEDKARSLYKQAAEKDHLLSRYYYALMLIDGRGGDIDYKEAESHLIINHENQHIPSSYSLGYIYFRQQQHLKVIELLKNNKNNNEYSNHLLAISYLELNRNISQAINLLQQSAEKGHKYSHLLLGDIYHHGLYDIPIDTKKSFTHLKTAAENELPEALFDLAILSIDNLELIDNDINIAINNLKSADEKGYPAASFELAKLYDQGELIKQDFNEAIYWYKKSASHGNNKAMYNLASIYINGDGVNSSISQAEYWLKKSALKGNKRAINILSKNN
ncbi:SEL1-like repeat protein [Photobacterium kishitanii]|uniref:SEL1-like repeat protein n=1 Tax=Photobacterium kishitanii TaxID=318456 RepID=UPI002738A330|nr:SEL1-like repeat protein [Photobacterium kishitanii]